MFRSVAVLVDGQSTTLEGFCLVVCCASIKIRPQSAHQTRGRVCDSCLICQPGDSLRVRMNRLPNPPRPDISGEACWESIHHPQSCLNPSTANRFRCAISRHLLHQPVNNHQLPLCLPLHQRERAQIREPGLGVEGHHNRFVLPRLLQDHLHRDRGRCQPCQHVQQRSAIVGELVDARLPGHRHTLGVLHRPRVVPLQHLRFLGRPP